MTSEYRELEPAGQPVGLCVVVPGRQYSPDGPALFFAGQVALARGWRVRQIWWTVPRFESGDDELAWVSAQLTDAVGDHQGRVLVVAKSLGTLAASAAAAHGYDAIWLTPILTEPLVADALRDYPARQLVAIGSEDPYLDRDVLAALPGRVVELPGDHIFGIGHDVPGSVRVHADLAHEIDSWLAEVSA